jgi:hypothetical protein
MLDLEFQLAYSNAGNLGHDHDLFGLVEDIHWWLKRLGYLFPTLWSR